MSLNSFEEHLTQYCILEWKVGMRRFLHEPYFLGGIIDSLQGLDKRNFTTVFAGIWIASPVAGLRPFLFGLLRKTSFPRPGMMNTPDFFVSLYASCTNTSKKAATSFLERPDSSERADRSSDFFIGVGFDPDM